MSKLVRFSLAAMFFAVLVVAGFFAGLDRGYRAGRSEWMALPTYTKSYPVKELIFFSSENQKYQNAESNQRKLGGITLTDFAPTIEDVKREVLPHVWQNDPNTTINPAVGELSLVVTGNATIHNELERYLAIERLNAKKKIINYHGPEDGG